MNVKQIGYTKYTTSVKQIGSLFIRDHFRGCCPALGHAAPWANLLLCLAFLRFSTSNPVEFKVCRPDSSRRPFPQLKLSNFQVEPRPDSSMKRLPNCQVEFKSSNCQVKIKSFRRPFLKCSN